ncbi:hypothetical protein [Paenibacillus periandrae]|uniref:hypothetical protein n=1 Tax=Paenibacillus periandrae TaxID=1761741 RepID=UPI001F08CE52|nr:hypothetical protein [Paenibacillus periandrae]
MELVILFSILALPVIVGLCTGFTTNTMTIDTSHSMNSRNEEEHFFESEHETDGWRPIPLTQPRSDLDEVGEIPPSVPRTPVVSSLPEEVENGILQLLGQLGTIESQVHQEEPPPDSYYYNEQLISHEHDERPAAPLTQMRSEEMLIQVVPSLPTEVDRGGSPDYPHDIDQMMESLKDTDIPPPDHIIEYTEQSSPLPKQEYHVIRRVFGSEFADQITTTPSIGATSNEVDVMMGRVNYTSDGIMRLTYNDASIPIRGIGITQDLIGQIVLVKGFFLDNDVFIVDVTQRGNAIRQEVL